MEEHTSTVQLMRALRCSSNSCGPRLRSLRETGASSSIDGSRRRSVPPKRLRSMGGGFGDLLPGFWSADCVCGESGLPATSILRSPAQRYRNAPWCGRSKAQGRLLQERLQALAPVQTQTRIRPPLANIRATDRGWTIVADENADGPARFFVAPRHHARPQACVWWRLENHPGRPRGRSPDESARYVGHPQR